MKSLVAADVTASRPDNQENEMITLVQEFVTYCEQNGMPSDEVGSAAFFANWCKVRARRELTTGEWNDLLDFVSPDAPPAVCTIGPGLRG